MKPLISNGSPCPLLTFVDIPARACARSAEPRFAGSAGVDRAGPAVGADRNIGEFPFRHLHEVVGVVGAADHPGLDADAQRAAADAVDIGIAGQYVAEIGRAQSELQSLMRISYA